jgi:hypothetical protein
MKFLPSVGCLVVANDASKRVKECSDAIRIFSDLLAYSTPRFAMMICTNLRARTCGPLPSGKLAEGKRLRLAGKQK